MDIDDHKIPFVDNDGRTWKLAIDGNDRPLKAVRSGIDARELQVEVACCRGRQGGEVSQGEKHGVHRSVEGDEVEKI